MRFLGAKYARNAFVGQGSAPDLTVGAYSAPPPSSWI